MLFAQEPRRTSPFEETPAEARIEPTTPASAAPSTASPPTPAGHAARQELFSRFTVDDAVKSASRDLDSSGALNTVTDGEASRALKTLKKLPPHLQGKAIEQLSDEAFDNLLGEVPRDQRELFLSLVESTHDPRRKLRLWEQYHLSKSHNDLERSGALGGKWFPSDADREKQRLDARRIGAVKTEETEVRGDVAALLKKKRLTERQVESLMKRKTLEHELEMEYALNFTSRGGADWDREDLEAVKESLAALPREHVTGKLSEVRREIADDSVYDFAAAYADGVVKVFASGAGDSHAVTHEIGHGVHDQETAAYKKYKQAAGWEEHDVTSLRKAGLTPEEIRSLNESLGVDSEKRKTVRKNGKIYQIDPYSGWYQAVDDTAIPEKGESGKLPATDDHYEYQRSSPKEHFAEHYARAVDEPAAVYQDLVELPAKREAQAQAKAQAAKERLEAVKRQGGDASAAQREVAAAYHDLARAQKAQRQRKAQFDIMRDDVFDTDDAVSAAAARLGNKGIAPGLMNDFHTQAAKLSTPAQIRELEKKFP